MNAVLVGNATAALAGDLGEWIDSMPMVVRMNAGGPTPANAAAIGMKTTHWSFSTMVAGDYENWRKLYPPGVIELRLNMRITYPVYNPNAVCSLPKHYAALMRTYPNTRPSTGAVTAAWLVNAIGASLTLVGFDFFSTGTWYNAGGRSAPHHPADEREFLEGLKNCRVILPGGDPRA